MGSWNGTCGLTRLPIIEDTEIYVFPIVPSSSNSFCYATALYRPSVLPFRAKYDDYGGGKDCSGPGLELLMSSIRDNLVEQEVGENEYHDIAVKREGFGPDEFFESVHKKRLMFKNSARGYPGQSETINCYFTMIRADAVEHLWNNWKFDWWKPRGVKEFPEGFETDNYYVKDVTYARLATLLPSYMEHRQTRENKLLAALGDKIDFADPAMADSVKYFKRHGFFEDDDDAHMLSSMLHHALSGAGWAGGGFSRLANIADAVLDLYEAGDHPAAYALLKEVMVGKMVDSFMSCVRCVWTPVMHQGSQSQEYEEYTFLNRMIDDIIAKETDYDD